MKKRFIRYKNEREIYNGTTTVIEGSAYIETVAGTPLDKATKDTCSELLDLINGCYFETKKVAKLCAGDEYDAKVGKQVAASKAEIKTSAKAVAYVKKVVEKLDNLKALLLEEIKVTEDRVEELKNKNF